MTFFTDSPFEKMALSVTGCSQKTATKNDDTKTYRAA